MYFQFDQGNSRNIRSGSGCPRNILGICSNDTMILPVGGLTISFCILGVRGSISR